MTALDIKALDLTPETLLPHDHPMILIDEIVDFGDTWAVAKVTPAPGKPFANEEGDVPSWVGMEYMAQTIGAYAGIMDQQSGNPVKVGFLLGTRAYDVDMDLFKCNQPYAIKVSKQYDDDGLSSFECTISSFDDVQGADSHIMAKAIITTFQPNNVDEFMEAGRT